MNIDSVHDIGDPVVCKIGEDTIEATVESIAVSRAGVAYWVRYIDATGKVQEQYFHEAQLEIA